MMSEPNETNQKIPLAEAVERISGQPVTIQGYIWRGEKWIEFAGMKIDVVFIKAPDGGGIFREELDLAKERWYPLLAFDGVAAKAEGWFPR